MPCRGTPRDGSWTNLGGAYALVGRPPHSADQIIDLLPVAVAEGILRSHDHNRLQTRRKARQHWPIMAVSARKEVLQRRNRHRSGNIAVDLRHTACRKLHQTERDSAVITSEFTGNGDDSDPLLFVKIQLRRRQGRTSSYCSGMWRRCLIFKPAIP